MSEGKRSGRDRPVVTSSDQGLPLPSWHKEAPQDSKPQRPRRRPRRLIRVLAALFALACIGALGAAAVAGYMVYHYGKDLPDYAQLADYEPPVTTRVYAGDGRLLAEFAVERRVFVPIEVVPDYVVDAFISAEDKTFFSHPGVDVFGIVRAVVTNIRNIGTDRRLVGASTITQQVAKNFLLGNEVSLDRKIKEAILSFRMEQAFPKKHILELYLNEIYLGRGSYGVAAASLNYFNKSLDELTIAEAAFLAALPKAPNNYDPDRYPEAAQARRDWVIGRMLEDGRIRRAEAQNAWATPIELEHRRRADSVSAGYFAEEVRREIGARYGETALYEGGLVIRTTLDPTLQDIAERALRHGLEDYDRRHGWRGPIAQISVSEDTGTASEGAGPASEGGGTGRSEADGAPWTDDLAKTPRPPGMSAAWRLAAVLAVRPRQAEIGFMDGSRGVVPLAEMQWARPQRREQTVGPAVRRVSDVVAVGDVVAVESTRPDGGDQAGAASQATPGEYALRQVPDVEGAIVALDPHTGRVLAMVGGYTQARSEFNRATQAMRQPGSAFKPFVYLTALENGYTPSTIILDAPISLDQGPGLPRWTPENYSNQFYGPTTMRVGLEKSRNVMTVRLAEDVGMARIAQTAEQFGIVDEMPPHLAYALGAGETTVLRLTTAYAMLVNGGKRIEPTLIDRIQDRHGRTVFRHDPRRCDACGSTDWTDGRIPQLPDVREQVTDPASAYQVVSMMRGVVERGTGRRVDAIGKPVAGKTGTTNDSKDTWFVGFTPDLVIGVFVGFDDPQTLGPKETGASVAAPIFRDAMAAALEGKPGIPFRIPPGIRLVRVNLENGRPSSRGHVILEGFKPGTVPTGREQMVGETEGDTSPTRAPTVGIGGLY